jgi:undecaprenyl-diphosphatase
MIERKSNGVSNMEFSVGQSARSVAVVGLGLVWLGMLIAGTGAVDQHILEAVYGGGHPAVVSIARVLTFTGSTPIGVPLVILGLMFLWLHRGRAAATAGFFVVAAGRAAVEAQKYGFHRLRPQIEPHLAVATSPSFPSGHASNSMIACLTFALLMFGDSKLRATAIATALLLTFSIGLSRPVLGVHWPSDVVGGWAFGLAWVILTLPLAQRLATRYFLPARGGGPNGS